MAASPVTVIGGIIMDVKAIPHHEVVMKTSNPSRLYYSPGGVGRNIAENLARLGVPVNLIGAVGEDIMADRLIAISEKTGINTSMVKRVKDASTSTDISFLTRDGDLLISCTDMEIAGQVTPKYLSSLENKMKQSSFLVADTNIPVASLQFLVDFSGKYGIPLIIEPVSVEMIQKIQNLKGEISLLTPNEQEWEAFCQKEYRCQIEEVLITCGEHGVKWQNAEGRISPFPAFRGKVVDTIGAGDALVAGVLFGLWRRMPMSEALRYGMAAATLAIGTTETVFSGISEERIKSFLAAH